MAGGSQVTVKHSAEIAALYQKANVKGEKLLELYPQYSKATIYRHAKKKISDECLFDNRKKNKGRPSKITDQHKRRILRAIPKLRELEGTFTAPRIRLEAGLEGKCSVRTVRRVLNKAGYFYLQSRKKGLMTAKDLKDRVKFCNKVRSLKLGGNFWTNHVSMYLDGKGFQYKTNPLDQARAPRAREYRKKGEGLLKGCTSKGRKEGATNANFMVAISYNCGVVLCEQYMGAINGKKMVEIVQDHFPKAFENSINPKGKLFLMDGCPRQNCKVAVEAIDAVGGKIFKIPSRSPDLNPIENFFHLVGKKLNKQAIERMMSYETFGDFSERVKKTMLEFDTAVIDNIIESMDKRITMVLKGKGNRIRY